MSAARYNAENLRIIRESESAARRLEVAWGRGGSLGEKNVWDEWFQEYAAKIVDLKMEGFLTPESESAALNVLALEDVPHWSHPDDIATIRAVLRGEQDWDDYPEKVRGGFDDDDEYY